jgi:membrane protein DedA with SNARE-associated domain
MVMVMNMLDVLLSIVSIASGVVVGTLLTWIISYYMGKRLLPKLLKSLSENPEIIKTIRTLRKNSESERTNGQKV